MSSHDRVYIAVLPRGQEMHRQWVVDGRIICDVDFADVWDLIDQTAQYLRHGRPKQPEDLASGPLLKLRGRSCQMSYFEGIGFMMQAVSAQRY